MKKLLSSIALPLILIAIVTLVWKYARVIALYMYNATIGEVVGVIVLLGIAAILSIIATEMVSKIKRNDCAPCKRRHCMLFGHKTFIQATADFLQDSTIGFIVYCERCGTSFHKTNERLPAFAAALYASFYSSNIFLRIYLTFKLARHAEKIGYTITPQGKFEEVRR